MRWLAGFVRPQAARLSAVLFLSLLATGLGLAQPYITRYLIDDGLIARRMEVILGLCGVLLAAALLSVLIGAVNRWQYVDASARVLFALREAVYRHLQRLSPGYFARARGGDMIARLDGDVAEIQRFAVDALLAMVNGIIALAATLALMASLSWKLSLLAFVLLPLQVLFLRRMRRKVEDRTRTVRERTSDITSFFFDTLGAMKFIQSVGAEDRQAERLGGLQDRFRGDLLRQQMTNFVTGAVPGLISALGTAVVFVAGGWLVIENQLSLGMLIAFSIYMARAMGPVQTLLGLYVASRRARVSLDRVGAIMNEQPAVRQPADPRPLPVGAAGEIRLDGVAFAYETGGPLVLRDADAVIPAGRKIGLVGASGVGKTTLIDLLHRHYDPAKGRILLDGVDLRELDLGELRRRIAVVAQDTVLFSGSLADNIRFAAPWADEEALRRAATLSRVDDFARSLPDGFNTDIGARGATLSGGQRQRIAIARAVLQDPLVLILDEATSAVDRETESSIAAAIDRLFPDRTRIVISHRPETLAGADPIFEMEDGTLRLRPRLGPVKTAP